jgi:hypothetical protein
MADMWQSNEYILLEAVAASEPVRRRTSSFQRFELGL